LPKFDLLSAAIILNGTKFTIEHQLTGWLIKQ